MFSYKIIKTTSESHKLSIVKDENCENILKQRFFTSLLHQRAECIYSPVIRFDAIANYPVVVQDVVCRI